VRTRTAENGNILFDSPGAVATILDHRLAHDADVPRRITDVRTCPECECQFDDTAEICPHCEVPLVLDEENESEPEEEVDDDLPVEGLVVIESTTDDARVGQVRELLEESGIPCFLSDELFPSRERPEETKVFIPKEMAGDARKLMRALAT
jgi:hypothetical protein